MNTIPQFKERDRGRFEDFFSPNGRTFLTEKEIWEWWDKWEQAGCLMYHRWPILRPASG